MKRVRNSAYERGGCFRVAGLFCERIRRRFFAEAVEDAELLVVPSVCVYEVFKVVLRERGEDAAFTAAAAMHGGLVVDLDGDLALEAAALGLEEGLAFADSVIYAVARRHNAVLWTQDVHFKGKVGVRYTSGGGLADG